MGKQFNNVSCRYGSPMGRHAAPDLNTTRGTVRLFAVRLDSGGYDDGGAYWGTRSRGERLWCAVDSDGDRQFITAPSRPLAAMQLEIPAPALVRGFDWLAMCAGMLNGTVARPNGWDGDNVRNYLTLCQAVARE